MEKSRDMKRGSSRLSRLKINNNNNNNKQYGIGPNLLSHSDLEFECLDKSKKEKIKSLSLVGGDSSFKEEEEMSCHFLISEGENIIPSKSHSTNKKFKHPKRSLDDCNGVDHASVPRKLRSAMKKRNGEYLSPPISDSKKPNTAVESLERNHARKQSKNMSPRNRGSITKDEEEVAETLYGLAKMFPDNNNVSSSLEPTPEPADKSVATEVKVNLKNSVCSSNETTKVNLSREHCVKADPDLLDGENLNMETDIHQLKLTSHVTKTLDFDFNVQLEASLDAGLSRSSRWNAENSKQETLSQDTSVETRLAKHEESKKNGPVLWPGLCSTLPKIEGNQCFSRSSSKPCSLEKPPSTTKVSYNSLGKSWMKRCSAHVYITHFIRGSKTPNCKDKSTQPCSNEPTGCKELKQNRVREGLNCVLSNNTIPNTSSDKNMSLQLNQQQHIALSSGLQVLKKQSFDFLTLSGGSRMESMSPQQVSFPYLQTLPQHTQLMPFPRNQTRFNPSAYNDHQLSAPATQEAQMQLPPFLRNSYSASPATSCLELTKQQQQQLWAAQLSGQYRSTGVVTSMMSQFPSWQNGNHESYRYSSSSSRYPQQQQQQQQQQQMQLMSFTPTATSVKRQEQQQQQRQSMYEESVGGCRPGGLLPLHLLCHDTL